jgi:hypothetical protein
VRQPRSFLTRTRAIDDDDGGGGSGGGDGSYDDNVNLSYFHSGDMIEETNCRNLFWKLDLVPSKCKLQLSNMVAALTVFWPFMQMFSKSACFLC